jgi:hypothetical protein
MNTRIILALALAITIWLAWFAPNIGSQSVADIAMPTQRANTITTTTSYPTSNTPAVPLSLAAREIAPSQINMFDTPAVIIAKTPTLKKVVYKPPPLPAPVAPPLPFKYIGKIETGESAGVLLDVKGEVTPINTGDVLLGQYQVQAINSNSAGVQVQLLYMPLNQLQTLQASSVH